MRYPQTTPEGRTVWACCASSIGPTCQHMTPPDADDLATAWSSVEHNVDPWTEGP